MPEGIIIFGLNGCGKTTLARALSEALAYKYMDIEDYYFLESEIPYTKARTKEDFLRVMKADMVKHKAFVLSALTGDFGVEISSYYKLGVYLKVDHGVRMDRVEKRALTKFGDRVKVGGDMYASHQHFLKCVRDRSDRHIEVWRSKLGCPVLEVDGTWPLEDIVDLVKGKYLDISRKD